MCAGVDVDISTDVFADAGANPPSPIADPQPKFNTPPTIDGGANQPSPIVNPQPKFTNPPSASVAGDSDFHTDAGAFLRTWALGTKRMQ